MQKKAGFFTKIKMSISKFEKYDDFSKEKVKTAIGYLVKLLVVFALIANIALVWTYKGQLNVAINKISSDAPEFLIENNELSVESDTVTNLDLFNDETVLLVLDDSDSINTEQILADNGKYSYIIFCLKDKVVLNQKQNEETNTSTYQYIDFTSLFELDTVSKQDVINCMDGANLYKILTAIYLFLAPVSFIMYAFMFLGDIIILATLAWLLVKLYKITLNYKECFNIAVYSLTLPIIIELIYLLLNSFTGFTIKYFDIMYNLISYVYIFAAIFIIKVNRNKGASDMMPIIEKVIKKEEKVEEKTKEEVPKEEKKDKKKEKDKKERS